MRTASSAAPVVLAVDDDPGVRDALSLVLEDDFEVVVATNGHEALKVLAVRSVDVVLLDLRMPQMDGHEVLARIRCDYCRTPVIVLSALADVPTVVAAMKLGAWDYVTKPWADEQLRERLHGAIRERRDQPGVLVVSEDVASLTPLQLALEGRERVFATNLRTALQSRFSAKAIVLHASAPSLVDQARVLCHRFPTAALLIMTDVAPAQLLQYLAGGVPVASVVEGTCFDGALHELIRLRLVRGVTPPHGVAKVAIQFIADRYAERITVADVAYAASLSEHRLAHVFRQLTGLSVKDYINRFRVAVGRRLLAETQEKMATISTQIGFADVSNFSKMFKQIDGLAPGKFRRSLSLSQPQ